MLQPPLVVLTSRLREQPVAQSLAGNSDPGAEQHALDSDGRLPRTCAGSTSRTEEHREGGETSRDGGGLSGTRGWSGLNQESLSYTQIPSPSQESKEATEPLWDRHSRSRRILEQLEVLLSSLNQVVHACTHPAELRPQARSAASREDHFTRSLRFSWAPTRTSGCP